MSPRPRRPRPSCDPLARLTRLSRLCAALEIDAYAGAIILDIVDRMDEIQAELDRLRALQRP